MDAHDDTCCSNGAALRIALREMKEKFSNKEQPRSDDRASVEPVVVWADWANSDHATHPYAVVVDPGRKAVVVTIRGTMSAVCARVCV